jgi:hypothetical protein
MNYCTTSPNFPEETKITVFSELEDDDKKLKCLQYVLLLLPEQNRMFLNVKLSDET